MKLLIYVPQITPRINYIFDFILTDLLGVPYIITDRLNKFFEPSIIKIQYSPNYTSIPNCLFIKANKLLFEEDIKQQKIEISNWHETKVFFQTGEQSFIPFDIFAAGFYLLSRYEEYLPFKPDKYGRFGANQSLAFKHNFIEQPVIDMWVGYFKSELLKHYPELKFKERKFRFISTIDIDNAYAYLHKEIFRSLLSSAKLIFNFKWDEFIEKISVHQGKSKDPYDSYQFLQEIHSEYNVQSIYFFLTAKYAKNDKNISPDNKPFKQLVELISEYTEIGIHPSYASNKNTDIVNSEKEKLEKLSGKVISKSRQHFLMLKFPETYRNLIKLGITEDYSMGYASVTGFRAGTCTPFYFFDLEADKSEKLKIIPFALMDVGLKEYNKLGSEDAIKEIEKIIENVKKVKGLFVSLWHNESLGNKSKWKNWKLTYERMIQYALNGN
ncbi:MAG: polysaccharide deacetylase family protein [Bacteroidota bacterium]